MKSLYVVFFALLMACCGGKAENEKFVVNRGVNIAHWLSQSDRRGAECDSFFTERDIRYIASLGFDHVRIPIDEEQMFLETGEKDSKAFSLLHQALDRCIKAGLRVVVDLHILRSHHFNASVKPLFTDSTAQATFCECWCKLSDELAKYPVGWVAYELMNEPVADDPEDWNKVAGMCFEAVRQLEPERVIVIGSNRWQSHETVKDLRVPENDKNIIISFHYYVPFLLTHYEASWTGQKDYHGPVHYPGVIVSQEELDSAEVSPETKKTVQWTAGQVFDKERMKRDFQQAADVAAKYGLQIYCGEYGCLNTSKGEDRLRWHRDMEAVFDSMGIARALWCYRESDYGFGILKINKPDEELINAMNLPSVK